MTKREIRNLVSWSVEEAPPEARIGGVLRSVLSTLDAVASLGAATGAASRPTWTLPADPDAYVGIGVVRVSGHAPWLPGGRSSRRRLQATRRAVLVADAADRRVPTLVPLEHMRIARARCHSVRRGVRYAEAPWTLTLTGAGTVDVRGAWLALAWIGHVAGWPEPARG